jgi:hypothetical protein
MKVDRCVGLHRLLLSPSMLALSSAAGSSLLDAYHTFALRSFPIILAQVSVSE